MSHPTSFPRQACLFVAAVVAVCAPLATLRAETADGPGWISLFDGTSLDGWKANESPQTWSVVDGAIVGNGPVSHLFYVGPEGKSEFGDFELKLEAKTTPNTNSGVFFRQRWQDAGWLQRGFEAQLQNSGDNKCYTGGLWQHAMRPEPSPVKDGEWFEVHITAAGGKVTVRINGVATTEYDEAAETRGPLKGLRSGFIALQGHGPKHGPAFRNIRIRPLPTAP